MSIRSVKEKGSGVPVAQQRHSSEFDFDRWARHVKQEMVAALKRRGSL